MHGAGVIEHVFSGVRTKVYIIKEGRITCSEHTQTHTHQSLTTQTDTCTHVHNEISYATSLLCFNIRQLDCTQHTIWWIVCE